MDPGRRNRVVWPLLVAVVIIGLVLIARPGAVPSGPAPSSAAPSVAAAESRSPTSAPSDRGLATFAGHGITFDYPNTWRAYRTNAVSMMGSTIAILGTADLSSCGGPDDVDLNCAYGTRLGPGDVTVVVGTGAMPGHSILDDEPAGGFREHIDGMPAIVESTGPIDETGQTVGRAWQIGWPGMVDNWYEISGAVRGPGEDDLIAQVDSVARSLRFDEPAPSLAAGGDELSGILARGLDALDRDARESYHSRMYACFPRAPGRSGPTVIDDGPGGPLGSPVTVTCEARIEPSQLGLYELTLTVTWDAGPGYEAGEYRVLAYLDPTGGPTSIGSSGDASLPDIPPPDAPRPGTTPPPIPPGSLVEVLYPGITFYLTPDLHGDALSSEPHGGRVWVVSGPQVVDGESWYRVQWRPTPTFDGIPGWIPATLDGHAAIAPASPRCPAAVSDVPDLVALHPAERLLCLGRRDVTIGHAFLVEAPTKTSPATGTPAWLADSAAIAMFGEAGPEGVEGPLLVRGAPAVDLTARLGSWLDVTGHFDDPAAAGCERRWVDAESGSPSPETPEEQVLTCREQFVITQVTPVPAP